MARRRKLKPSEIDWDAVREAQIRSRIGRATDADHALCQSAFDADRVRYGEMRGEVVAEATRRAFPFLE